jgi:hypothetical protein
MSTSPSNGKYESSSPSAAFSQSNADLLDDFPDRDLHNKLEDDEYKDFSGTQPEDVNRHVHVYNSEAIMTAALDGIGIGSRELLSKHLAEGECMMIWHLSSSSSHTLHVILAWKDDASYSYPKYTKNVSVGSVDLPDVKTLDQLSEIDSKRDNADKFMAAERDVTSVVMEIAKSDIDANHIHYLIGQFLTALHSRPGNNPA